MFGLKYQSILLMTNLYLKSWLTMFGKISLPNHVFSIQKLFSICSPFKIYFLKIGTLSLLFGANVMPFEIFDHDG